MESRPSSPGSYRRLSVVPRPARRCRPPGSIRGTGSARPLPGPGSMHRDQIGHGDGHDARIRSQRAARSARPVPSLPATDRAAGQPELMFCVASCSSWLWSRIKLTDQLYHSGQRSCIPRALCPLFTLGRRLLPKHFLGTFARPKHSLEVSPLERPVEAGLPFHLRRCISLKAGEPHGIQQINRRQRPPKSGRPNRRASSDTSV